MSVFSSYVEVRTNLSVSSLARGLRVSLSRRSKDHSRGKGVEDVSSELIIDTEHIGEAEALVREFRNVLAGEGKIGRVVTGGGYHLDLFKVERPHFPEFLLVLRRVMSRDDVKIEIGLTKEEVDTLIREVARYFELIR